MFLRTRWHIDCSKKWRKISQEESFATFFLFVPVPQILSRIQSIMGQVARNRRFVLSVLSCGCIFAILYFQNDAEIGLYPPTRINKLPFRSPLPFKIPTNYPPLPTRYNSILQLFYKQLGSFFRKFTILWRHCSLLKQLRLTQNLVAYEKISSVLTKKYFQL